MKNRSGTESPQRRNSIDSPSDLKPQLAVTQNENDKYHLIHKIQRFYDNHGGSTQRLTDLIMAKYKDLCFLDSSLKNIYEDMANQVFLNNKSSS